MSLGKMHSLVHTLAFRLAVYYAAVFTISFIMAFSVFYLIIGSVFEKNRDHDLKGDLAEFSSVFMKKGIEGVENSITLEMESEGKGNKFIRILNPAGIEIFSTDMGGWGSKAIPIGAQRIFKSGLGHYFETWTIPDREQKARIIYGAIGQGVIVQVGESVQDDEAFLEKFRKGFGFVMILIIPFATFIGWLMGRKALQGVEQVTQTAMEISRGDLDRRVTISTNAEEITRLASTFNGMLDKITTLVASIRNMTDDITHDLKKPIVRIRIIAEKGLYKSDASQQHDPDAARILEECDSLMQMINTILDVSEAQAGAAVLDMKHVDIAVVVRSAHELFYPLAEDKHLRFTVQAPETCTGRGDIHKIQRMITNILDNAIKYTPAYGEVSMNVKQENGSVKISIRDSGIGISNDDLPCIFERFYRCDQSRSEQGLGLGLTLAKAIAVSHGGDIVVESIQGTGSTFIIMLPVS